MRTSTILPLKSEGPPSAVTIPCVCGGTSVGKPLVAGYSRSREWVEIRPCTSCGLARTYPPPDPDALDETVYQSEGGFADQVRDYPKFRGYARKILTIFEDRFGTDRGTLLDVGCGIGALVAEALERGYTARGIDINEKAVRYGVTCLGLPLSAGSAASLRDHGDRFDTVILSQVLEHLKSPATALQGLSQLLSPGGRIVIESPNMAGLYARLLRAHWYPYGVSQHLWHFTPETIGVVAKYAGLRLTFVAARRCVDYRQPQWLTPLVDLPGTLFNAGDNLLAAFEV